MLDEADQLLSLGFKKELAALLAALEPTAAARQARHRRVADPYPPPLPWPVLRSPDPYPPTQNPATLTYPTR